MELYRQLMMVALIALTYANYTKEQEQVVYPDQLPADPFTAELVGKLRMDLQDYQGGKPLSEDAAVALDRLEDLGEVKRKKREVVSNYNAAYCCIQQTPEVKTYQTAIAMRTRTQVIQAGGSIPCGLWGWSRCASDAQKTIVVQQYYVDNYVPLSVPAPEWVNGCPLDQIVCCPSYVEMNEQCFSHEEVAEIITLQRMFCRINIVTSILGLPFNENLYCVTETTSNEA